MTGPPFPPRSLDDLADLVEYAAGPITAAEVVMAIVIGLLALTVPRLGHRAFARIDAPIVWAHRLGPEKDAALLRHFANRRVWDFRWDPQALGGYRFELADVQEARR